ncbi:MAG: hypothetical protein H6Q85_987 [candidate division NC10 bacterium]|jgi:hypothetical protein|nr:hypothetical protein [candidate division NC10 bacterium]
MRLSRDIYETGFQPSLVYVHNFLGLRPWLVWGGPAALKTVSW